MRATAGRGEPRPSPSAAPERVEAPGAGLGVVHRDPRSPLDVGDERGPELGIVGQPRVVGGEAEQRGEAKPLLGRDLEVAMLGDHVLVTALLLGVARRSAEHLAPPQRDVRAMLLAHAARKQRRNQVVLLDAVVEGVQEAPNRGLTTGPLVERLGLLGHTSIMAPAP